MSRRGFLAAAIFALFFFISADSSASDVLRINGNGAAFASMEILAKEFMKANPDIKVVMTRPVIGSTGAISALSDGALDIALSARPLNNDEQKKGLKELYYAKSPFVFAVSKSNKGITGLSLKDAVDIYSGNKKTYKDRSPIRIILRPEHDSDTKMLKDISDEMSSAVRQAFSRKGMIIAPTDIDAAEEIEKIDGAIGNVVLSLIISEKRGITPLAFNGVSALKNKSLNPEYPYYRRFYLITKVNPSPLADRFLDFVRSKKGNEILLKTGHAAD